MKLKEVVSEKPKPTACDVTVNAAYLMALALELMIRDIERRLAMQNATIQREKKRKYSMFLDHYKKALYFAEQLTEDIFEVDAENKWRNIPVWQEESNELARLILLYADRSADSENVNKVFKLLRELPGEGIINEEVLKNYYLKK